MRNEPQVGLRYSRNHHSHRFLAHYIGVVVRRLYYCLRYYRRILLGLGFHLLVANYLDSSYIRLPDYRQRKLNKLVEA